MNKKIKSLFTWILQTSPLALAIVILLTGVFAFFEPEVAKGVDDFITVTLVITSEISISDAEDLTLPQLSGLVGGNSTSTRMWTVKTNNGTGYNIGVKASTTPALQTADPVYNLADYTPGSAGIPDFDWALATAVAEFGFAPFNAASQHADFKNNGTSACATGTETTNEKCWLNFATTTKVVASKATKTAHTGEDTTINFKAQYDIANGTQEGGTYTATITVTAVVN